MNPYWEQNEVGFYVSELSLDEIVNMVDGGMPFSFSRWGDGEWAAVLGKEGLNCDGHKYFPELGAKLRDVLFNIDFSNDQQKKYYDHFNFKGILPCAHKAHGDTISEFVWANNVQIDWFDGMAVLDANREGKLGPLFRAIRKNKKAAYVGNRNIKQVVSEFLGDVVYIQIPEIDCFLERESIKMKIYRAILENDVNFVGFSAGMTSNVVIEEVWQIAGKLDLTLFDFGSIFDPYAGRLSRRYMEKVDWGQVRKKNGR